MDNEERQDHQQQQQRKDHDLLRSERKARGELLNAHLEAGREQARSDKARAAEYKARKETDQAAMKTEARRRYEGSDHAFEQDWPDIREKLVMEKLEKDLKDIRSGL